MSDLSKEELVIAKRIFILSWIITLVFIVAITIGICLAIHSWAPWWVYLIEVVIVALVGWDMTTWQGSDADCEIP